MSWKNLVPILMLLVMSTVTPAHASPAGGAQQPFLWSRLEPFDEGLAEAPRTSQPGHGYNHKRALMRQKTVRLKANPVSPKRFPSDTVPSSSGVNTNDNVQYGTPVGGPAAAPWAYPPRYYYIYGYPNPNSDAQRNLQR